MFCALPPTYLSPPSLPPSSLPLPPPSSLSLPPSLSDILGDVIQCPVRQVCHAAAVRLLSLLGPGLGVPQVHHHEGTSRPHSRHHRSPGTMYTALNSTTVEPLYCIMDTQIRGHLSIKNICFGVHILIL